MRRFLIPLFAAGLGGLFALPAAAASPAPLIGMFSQHFVHAGGFAVPCPTDVFCGVGDLRGFGPAEIDNLYDNFQPVAGTSCLSFDKEDDISLIGTSSTLVLFGSGVFCPPGNSGTVPTNANNKDFGHPGFWTVNLTVDPVDSSGVFQGATGTVTETLATAGGAAIWHLRGTITTV